jgi:hypothetical protein
MLMQHYTCLRDGSIGQRLKRLRQFLAQLNGPTKALVMNAPSQYARQISLRRSRRQHRIHFVPVLETPTEWQRTMIARLYNQSHQVVAEEVFNLVMVQESTGENTGRWLPVYELSFLNGYPYVHYQPGMYAAFALGVPIVLVKRSPRSKSRLSIQRISIA